MSDKVCSIDQAVAGIRDGDHVALTGFAITRNSIAATLALIRAGPRDLTISQVIGGLETDLIVASGCVHRLIYAGGSLDRFGSLNCVNRAIALESIKAAEYSALALTFRFQAAALGLPFLPAKTMLGSELLEPLVASGEVRVGSDPFDGAPVIMLAPLRPDVALVHADVADSTGNATISGPLWSLRETALAATTVIVTAEKIVKPGEIPPSDVTIPAPFVSAVAPAPRGAAPTAVYGHYDFDRETLHQYVQASSMTDDAALSIIADHVYAEDGRRG